MGAFAAFLYDGTQWLPYDDDIPDAADPWLAVDIYDSDIATVRYAPAGPGTGIAYLGDTPRNYFQDDEESAPIDIHREAAGLAAWWSLLHDIGDAGAIQAKEAELGSYLATDTASTEAALDEQEDEPDTDEGELFVEIKTARFLTALDLPPLDN